MCLRVCGKQLSGSCSSVSLKKSSMVHWMPPAVPASRILFRVFDKVVTEIMSSLGCGLSGFVLKEF